MDTQTTDPKATEESRSLEATLSAMPVGVSWADVSDQKIVYVNRTFTGIFGYELADLTNIADWISAYPYVEDRETARKGWSAYFVAPNRFEFPVEPMELRIPCKDGTIKTIIHSGVVLPEVGWALATFIDISDRKRDELLLQAAERQARESQAIYRLLLDHSPEMIVLVPFDQTEMFVSPAVERITGFTAEEYLASTGFEMIHPDQRLAVSGLRATLERQPDSHTLRYRTLLKTGGYCWVEATVSPYMDTFSQQVAGYVSIIRDISKQKGVEDALAAEKLQLESLASIDELTGIANRRTFNRVLEREARRQTRANRDLSLMLLDIDHFKGFNDLYGHVAGDSCLRAVAGAIKSCTLRDADLTARYGGEEFVVLMPLTLGAGAEKIARKVIEAVTALALPHAGSSYGIVTVSIGIASSGPETGTSSVALVQQADLALYRAKKAGRNRYEVQEATSGASVPS